MLPLRVPSQAAQAQDTETPSPGPMENILSVCGGVGGATLGPAVLPGDMTVFPVQVKCSGPIRKEMVLWRYLQS